MDCAGGKKSIVIFVPVPQLKAFQKIQTRYPEANNDHLLSSSWKRHFVGIVNQMDGRITFYGLVHGTLSLENFFIRSNSKKGWTEGIYLLNLRTKCIEWWIKFNKSCACNWFAKVGSWAGEEVQRKACRFHRSAKDSGQAHQEGQQAEAEETHVPNPHCKYLFRLNQ